MPFLLSGSQTTISTPTLNTSNTKGVYIINLFLGGIVLNVSSVVNFFFYMLDFLSYMVSLFSITIFSTGYFGVFFTLMDIILITILIISLLPFIAGGT